MGAPRGARPTYEISDPYLAFWFGVLYADVAHIEAGQGSAVLRRRRPQWQRHLGWAFEELARDHARRLVAEGVLPSDIVIGRWWAVAGEPCEIDVLGLRGSRAYLLGEARWHTRPLGRRDLRELERKVACHPAVDEPVFALWGRSGTERAVRGPRVLGFDVDDALAA